MFYKTIIYIISKYDILLKITRKVKLSPPVRSCLHSNWLEYDFAKESVLHICFMIESI